MREMAEGREPAESGAQVVVGVGALEEEVHPAHNNVRKAANAPSRALGRSRQIPISPTRSSGSARYWMAFGAPCGALGGRILPWVIRVGLRGYG